MSEMRRDFSSREEMLTYLEKEFPSAHARAPQVSETLGGRKEALKRLAKTSTGKSYEKTRNYLDGTVTRLSPYIRYGVLSLAEVRDEALSLASHPLDVEKFINELGVRHYWQLVYKALGHDIWKDIEAYKTGFSAHQYADILPDDIRQAETGVRFIDDFITELYDTGYIHNHARMWLAGYVVHWRRIKWQVGARWFLEHLLDGDPASNNLSWQWVASTFSQKPYFYNLENVIRFTGDKYKGNAEVLGHEDVDASYDDLARRLFPNVELGDNQRDKPQKRGNRK